jgi:hypothetical protein
MARDISSLADDVQRLHRAVAQWSPSRWAGRTADGRTRADVMFALVSDLAVLAARGGSGAPTGAIPHRIGAHALADQLVVIAGDVLTAPRAADLLAETEHALTATRRLLLR